MSEKNLQKTIQKDVALEGVGLHSGKTVHLVFKNAPAGHGIRFVRVDLPGRPQIKVNVSSVIDVEKHPRRSSLGNDTVEVQTVEHLMAALFALEIDNLIIEIDGIEVPGLDGSALGFFEVLQKGGLATQDQLRHVFRVREPIYIEERGASLTILPSNALCISYMLVYNHPRLRSQFYEIILNGSNFAKEIAPSRTFVLEQEAELLQKQGLGQGANYENTLVVGEKGIIQNTLRFEDEFARHKILDLVGDLYLMGCPVQGHIIAYRSGHPLNMRLIQKLKEQEDKLLHWGVVAEERITKTEMDLEAVKRIIPHRDPFLFVDKIVEYEDGKRAVGIKVCKPEEAYFKGHFPDRPIMPGVLIVECLAQVAGILVLNKEGNRGKYAYFISIENMKFRKAVLPGDTLVLVAEIIRLRERSGRARTVASVDGKVVAEGEMMFALVDA